MKLLLLIIIFISPELKIELSLFTGYKPVK